MVCLCVCVCVCVIQEDSEVWYVRPCPVSLLKVMALGVVHLLPLRLVLLDALMADYTGLVDSYLRASRQEPVHTQHIGTVRHTHTHRYTHTGTHMHRYTRFSKGLYKCNVNI